MPATTTFGIRPNAEVEVMIDGAYLYNVCRGLNFELDYEKLRSLFFTEYDCRRISYFMKVAYDEQGEIRQGQVAKLLDFLRYNGYTTILGEQKEWTDNSGRRAQANSVDVALTVAMLEASQRVKEIVLFAGSEDLATAVEAVAAQGPRVTLVSSIHTKPVTVANELRGAADLFVDLVTIKDAIIRREREFSTLPVDRNIDRATGPAEAVVVQDRRRLDSSLGARMRVHPRSVDVMA